MTIPWQALAVLCLLALSGVALAVSRAYSRLICRPTPPPDVAPTRGPSEAVRRREETEGEIRERGDDASRANRVH